MRVLIRLLISLLLVGALVGCSTQKIESPGATKAPAKQLYVGLHTKDYEVRVKIEPLLPGTRPATLKLVRHEGETPAGTLLALELSQAGAGAAQRFEAKPQGNGEYKVDAIPLVAGTWQIRAIVTVPGSEPQSVTYTFAVPAS